MRFVAFQQLQTQSINDGLEITFEILVALKRRKISQFYCECFEWHIADKCWYLSIAAN